MDTTITTKCIFGSTFGIHVLCATNYYFHPTPPAHPNNCRHTLLHTPPARQQPLFPSRCASPTSASPLACAGRQTPHSRRSDPAHRCLPFLRGFPMAFSPLPIPCSCRDGCSYSLQLGDLGGSNRRRGWLGGDSRDPVSGGDGRWREGIDRGEVPAL
jgi:hypothetical protein